MRRTLLRAVLTLVAFGVALPLALAADNDPVVGTWQLNGSKSKFTAGPALKSQTRTYTQSGKELTLVIRTTGPDGKETTSQTTYELNGKDYPVTGTADYDSVAGRQLNPNTARFTLKKGGKVVGTSSRTLSKDGKTLTVKNKLTTADGAQTQGTLVFDRQ